MGIAVRDILKLNIFKNSEILAGEKGLNKIINRVSVFDCPVEEKRDKLVLKDGDFFISNIFFFKDNLDYSIYTINFLNSCNCSGLCITNEYINSFSKELKDYCNKIDFPIITIDYTVSYGDIIRDISYLLFKNEKNHMLEIQLVNLLNTYSFIDTKKLLNTINPHFLDYITSIYFYSNNLDYEFSNSFINLLNQNKNHICIPYKNGYILIISYSKISQTNISSMISYFVDTIKNNVDKYVIGISNNNIDLIDTKTAVSQALLCSSSIKTKNCTIINYNDLGIISLLFSYKDTPEVKNFYDSIITPIKEHDNKYNKDLLNTLVSFVECGGDYKACSNKIFQHENTIRYRILKIKSILSLENSLIEFYERVSIAVKLHIIYNNL